MRRPGSRIRNPNRENVGRSVISFFNFTPLHFKPILWLDASDLSTITSASGAVSQWNDKSGNAYHFSQATSTARPITGTRTVNGLNALDFDGTDDRLFRNSISLVNQTTGTFTAFAVVLPDVITSSHLILNGDADPLRAPQFLRFNASLFEAIRIMDLSGTINTVTGSLSATAGVAVCLASRLDTANLQVFSDRQRSTPLAATNGAYAVLATHDVGSYKGLSGLYFNGLICEIITYNYPLTDNEIGVVQEYLRKKWNTP